MTRAFHFGPIQPSIGKRGRSIPAVEARATGRARRILGASAAALLGTAIAAAPASADTINIRIASGHPPTVVYAGLMKNFFQPELKKAVEAKTKYKVNFIEGYSGSIVKVFDTLEGVQNGVVDIGGFCYCFEASKLPMHAFQIMLPFGTMDPVQSVAAAADIYRQFPSLEKRFQDFNQTLIAIIGDGGYNLGTQFAWKTLDDLKGRKILGAGLNLNWMKQAGIGIVPVTDGLPGWYQKLKTGVAQGGIMFPSAWGKTFGLWEVGKYYTTIGFGSITWHGLTVNNRFWSKLPAEVKPIIQEVAGPLRRQVAAGRRTHGFAGRIGVSGRPPACPGAGGSLA